MNNIELVKNAMINYFDSDIKRINHALSVLSYARKIMENEEVESKEVVEVAAILHDIGIKQAENKYNSTSGHYQEIEGPPIANDILTNLGYDYKFIDEVCNIIAHHHTPGKINTKNFQVLYEADWLVNLQDDFLDLPLDKKIKLIETNFKTKTGKALAYEVIK